jgi:hypothetical protein
MVDMVHLSHQMMPDFIDSMFFVVIDISAAEVCIPVFEQWCYGNVS